MKFLPIILRNIRRNRRRSTFTVAGIGLSVFVVSALLSVEGGFATLFDSTGASVLTVYEKGVACPFSSRVFDSYAGTIGTAPQVTGATGVLRGMYSYQTKENLVAVSGVDYDQFTKAKSIAVLEGSEGDFAARADGALVGRRVARDYGWHAGQAVSLLEDHLSFQISGLFGSDDKSLEGGVLLHKSFLAKIKRDEGRSTYILVSVTDPAAIPSVSRFIDGELANYPKPTKTQSEKAAKERELKDFREIRRMLSVMLMATVIVSIFGAANSVSMSVRERTREVGILRSLGFRRSHILHMLIAESSLLAAAGGALGLSATLGLVASAKSLGGMVPLILSPAYAILGIGIALMIGFLAALVPSVNASRLKIVVSLRPVD